MVTLAIVHSFFYSNFRLGVVTVHQQLLQLQLEPWSVAALLSLSSSSPPHHHFRPPPTTFFSLGQASAAAQQLEVRHVIYSR